MVASCRPPVSGMVPYQPVAARAARVSGPTSSVSGPSGPYLRAGGRDGLMSGEKHGIRSGRG